MKIFFESMDSHPRLRGDMLNGNDGREGGSNREGGKGWNRLFF